MNKLDIMEQLKEGDKVEYLDTVTLKIKEGTITNLEPCQFQQETSSPCQDCAGRISIDERDAECLLTNDRCKIFNIITTNYFTMEEFQI